MVEPNWDLVIEKGKIEKNYWKDIWKYKELLYILSWKDFKVRYKQTFIGASWAVIRPVLTMVIFTIVFSRVAKLPSDGIPYPLLVFSGLLPWTFFSSSLSEGSGSLIANSNLISKVYFPRIIIPTSSIFTNLVDMAIMFAIFLAMLVYYQYVPSWRFIFLPLFIVLAILFSFGVSLYLASLNVKYRDFRYIVPFIVQFGLYISPVGFSSSIVPADLKYFFALNPVVGVIEGFRWCFFGSTIDAFAMMLSVIVGLIAVVGGVVYFRQTEKTFADNI